MPRRCLLCHGQCWDKNPPTEVSSNVEGVVPHTLQTNLYVTKKLLFNSARPYYINKNMLQITFLICTTCEYQLALAVFSYTYSVTRHFSIVQVKIAGLFFVCIIKSVTKNTSHARGCERTMRSRPSMINTCCCGSYHHTSLLR